MVRGELFFLLFAYLVPFADLNAQAPLQPGKAQEVRRYINLEPLWDSQKVCSNPHKGWYIHYYDNGLGRYGKTLAADDDLKDFPGVNDIYLRLAWSYLEPEEGKFNWQLIDEQIERWTRYGYAISFRISCKEYGDAKYATPKWVQDAGARGKMINLKGIEAWEPDYGDAVFLRKLENFHREFAKRYDGKPWLEYVDIGSYGDWGEAHTAFSERREWPADVIKKHIDIYRRNYRKSLLVISDDIVGSRESTDGSREEIFDYLVKNNITLRDDGVSVKWFADRFGASTLRNPEFFQAFWKRLPINLELEHYDNTVKENTWKGGVPFAKAIEEAHATYIGFHGYPREWLRENEQLAKELANRAGYWYFVRSAVVPEFLTSGKPNYFNVVFINKGVAPAYHRYKVAVRLKGSSKSYTQVLESADNRKWMPGEFHAETQWLNIPKDLPPGQYDLEIGLYHERASAPRFLELPFSDAAISSGGFYKLTTLELK